MKDNLCPCYALHFNNKAELLLQPPNSAIFLTSKNNSAVPARQHDSNSDEWNHGPRPESKLLSNFQRSGQLRLMDPGLPTSGSPAAQGSMTLAVFAVTGTSVIKEIKGGILHKGYYILFGL